MRAGKRMCAASRSRVRPIVLIYGERHLHVQFQTITRSIRSLKSGPAAHLRRDTHATLRQALTTAPCHAIVTKKQLAALEYMSWHALEHAENGAETPPPP
eukprot:545260-Pelagomonas_calceolata.AAC.1